jgi:polygalacturonase
VHVIARNLRAGGACSGAQVTLAGVELYDAVHYAVHVLRSEEVAIVNVTVWGDPLIPASSGVIIDGSRRVVVGGCSISTADNAIGLKTTAGARHARPAALLTTSWLGTGSLQ